jgi:eukaryotic-like serine/threonine-protein kinase
MLSDGTIVFCRAGTLYALPFDPRTLAAAGPAVAVLQGVYGNATSGSWQFAISRNGTLVYTQRAELSEHELVEVERAGRARPLPNGRRPFSAGLALSPDGTRIAASIGGTNFDLWIYDLAREVLSRFTTDPGLDQHPAWTPDGKEITFSAGRAGPRNLFQKAADESAPEQRLSRSDSQQYAGSWSPDGRHLAYSQLNPETAWDVFVFEVGGKTAPFVRTQFLEQHARFSPDGKWIAYTSDASGQSEVYVQAFPGPGARHQVSSGGGQRPIWHPGGRELFYRNGDRLMAVEVRAGTTFVPGVPRVLFEGPYGPDYDVSRDGQKFYMVRIDPSAAASQLNVVLNWTEEVRRRLGR